MFAKRFLVNNLSPLALAAAAALALSIPVLTAQDQAPPLSDPGQAQASGARTDGQIEMDVVQALDGSAALKNDLITAATIQGAVTLSGTVASDANKQLAESIVAKVPGVTKVNNNLKVGNPANDPNAQTDVDNAAPPTEDNQANPATPPTYQAPEGNPPPQQQSQNYPQQQQPQNYPPQPGYGQQPPPAQQPPYGQQPGYGYPPPPPPPGYRQPYPQPYAQPYQRPAPYSFTTSPLTVPQGTVLQVRTNDAMSSKKAKAGTPIDFTVIRDVTQNGYLAIPRGAIVHGVLAEVKHAGALTGSPELGLQVTSLDIDGHTYPIESDLFKVKGPSKTGRTVSNAIGGALVGALIGGAAGGGSGAAIGAAAGGGAGTAVSAVGSPQAWIPAEALVVFHITAPVTVDPVTREQATRLAQGLYQGGPSLYRRGYYGGYGYPAGYYPYPPVYYRPYYVVGGYYYWR